MSGGNRWAWFLAVIVACMQTAGCGGGGTPRLMVTTTSLPNGVIGVAYVASLTATGGTPGYTWSQTSGGDMPGGVSLGSNGVFNGTPNVAGSFGPYIFQVADSTGTKASSVSLSIMVSGGAAAASRSANLAIV